MSIHESVENAACITSGDTPKSRARRVLAAQAKPEAISDGAVKAAWNTFHAADSANMKEAWEAMRAALSAALLHMAKEGE